MFPGDPHISTESKVFQDLTLPFSPPSSLATLPSDTLNQSLWMTLLSTCSSLCPNISFTFCLAGLSGWWLRTQFNVASSGKQPPSPTEWQLPPGAASSVAGAGAGWTAASPPPCVLWTFLITCMHSQGQEGAASMKSVSSQSLTCTVRGSARAVQTDVLWHWFSRLCLHHLQSLGKQDVANTSRMLRP